MLLHLLRPKVSIAHAHAKHSTFSLCWFARSVNERHQEALKYVEAKNPGKRGLSGIPAQENILFQGAKLSMIITVLTLAILKTILITALLGFPR